MPFLPGPLKAVINAILATTNILFWGLVILLLATFKVLLPIPAARRQVTRACDACMSGWVAINRAILGITTQTQWRIRGLEQAKLDRQGWYLVLANHLSWADIFVVTAVLHNRVPMLKFFLKQQLIYIPVMGLACWALDMPFMRRYSKSQLAKNPKLKGRDIAATRRSCEKFKHLPTCVINFVEGSRLTPAKHRRQRSPYHYLMKPKAGGIAFALNTLGEQFDQILDVTLVYPDAPENIMYGLLSGQLSSIDVAIKTLPIAEVPHGNYDSDKAFRVEFQQWLNGLWREKDATIAEILKERAADAPLYRQLALP